MPGSNDITYAFNPGDFDQWRGYAPAYSFVTQPYRTTGQTRRNTPLTGSPGREK